jgi:hypothetical protein
LESSEPYKWHAFFNRPRGLIIRKKSKTELGVNTESNGQVLLPLSRHKSGVRYSIDSDLPIADAPPNLIVWLQSLPLERQEKTAKNGQNSVSPTPPAPGSIAARILGVKECPPFDAYECVNLESALWYCDAAGVRVLDPCDPSFDAWARVLYPLAWLIRNGWPWEWVLPLLIDWSAEAEGMKDEQGCDIYPGSEECERRLRHAVERGDGVANPKPWARSMDLSTIMVGSPRHLRPRRKPPRHKMTPGRTVRSYALRLM